MIVYSQQALSDHFAGVRLIRNDRIAYDNVARLSTVTASSEQPGFSASTLRNGLTQIYWRPLSLPATVDIVPPTLDPVDFLGLAGHDLGSNNVRVTLQGFDGVGYTDILSAQPTTDEPIALIFSPQVYQSYRLVFDDPEGIASIFSLAVAYLSSAMVMERGPDFGYQPVELSRDDQIIPQRSGSGGFIGAVVERRGNKSSVSYSNLTNSFYRNVFDRFVEFAVTTPFFHISLPEPAIVEQTTLDLDFAGDFFGATEALGYPNSGVSFVRCPRNISPSKGQNNGRFNVSFEMEGLTRG